MPVISPAQSVGDVLMIPGIEGIHETDQTAPQPPNPFLRNLIWYNSRKPTTPNVSQQPLEILNVPGERRMADMGTNTSDVMIEPTGSGQKPSCMETNAQPSIPIVDVLLPSGFSQRSCTHASR